MCLKLLWTQHFTPSRAASCRYAGEKSRLAGGGRRVRPVPALPALDTARRQRGCLARPGGGDVAGRSRRSTATTRRGKPRAGPRRAGRARARRRVARHIVRPRRGPHVRGTRRCGSAARRGAAAPGSIPTRPSSGRAPGGRAPDRNRVEGGAGGSQSLTERGRCVGGLLGVRSHGSFLGGRWSRGSEAWVPGGTTHATVPLGGTAAPRPELFNGLGGDGAWRPRDHRERTRQALGLAGVAAGLGVWPAWSGARAPTLRWTVPAASIRRRSRPNTAFRLRGSGGPRGTDYPDRSGVTRRGRSRRGAAISVRTSPRAFGSLAALEPIRSFGLPRLGRRVAGESERSRRGNEIGEIEL